MKKLNYSAECIKHLYKARDEKRSEIIQNFVKDTGIQPKYAYGNIYFQIEETMTEQKNKYFNDICGYGGVNFLGNINGKGQYQLYFKTGELKKHFKNLIEGLHNNFEESQELLKQIRETHGEPNVQYCLLTN